MTSFVPISSSEFREFQAHSTNQLSGLTTSIKELAVHHAKFHCVSESSNKPTFPTKGSVMVQDQFDAIHAKYQARRDAIAAAECVARKTIKSKITVQPDELLPPPLFPVEQRSPNPSHSPQPGSAPPFPNRAEHVAVTPPAHPRPELPPRNHQLASKPPWLHSTVFITNDIAGDDRWALSRAFVVGSPRLPYDTGLPPETSVPHGRIEQGNRSSPVDHHRFRPTDPFAIALVHSLVGVREPPVASRTIAQPDPTTFHRTGRRSLVQSDQSALVRHCRHPSPSTMRRDDCSRGQRVDCSRSLIPAMPLRLLLYRRRSTDLVATAPSSPSPS